MLSHPRTQASSSSPLLDLRARVLGAQRHPFRLALAAMASALLVLITQPLASPRGAVAVMFFLGLATYLILVTDDAAARKVEAEVHRHGRI